MQLSLLVPLIVSIALLSAPPAALGAEVWVSSFGAVPDDGLYDTAAIQLGVDSLLPGDTLLFDPGTYLIHSNLGIRLKDNIRLVMEGATLVAPNVNGRKCRIFTIEPGKGITLSGGTLVGSRAGSPTWGVGIFASDAEDLVIENMTLRDFYFDGILLTGNNGCRNVTIRGVLSENNRRTGLAIPAASDVLIESSTFRGSTGQSPEAGVNVEPNPGNFARNIRFVGSTAARNRGIGFYAHRGLGVSVSEIRVERAVLEDNYQGVVIGAVTTASVTGSRFARHQRAGIHLGDVAGAVVTDNQFNDNIRGILTAGGSGNEIRRNTVIGKGPMLNGGPEGHGIICLGTPGVSTSGCVVTDNTVERSSASGIAAYDAANVRFQNNTIVDSGERGMYLLNSSNSELSNNRVHGSSLSAPHRHDGVELGSGSNNNLMTLNTIYETSAMRKSISVSRDTYGNVVVLNTVVKTRGK